MKSAKRVFSYALILAMTSQLFIPLFIPLAKADTVSALESFEQKALAASSETDEPSRAERKFFKRFDRKFKRFADDVYEMVEDYSSAELNEMYESMIIWLEQHGNYAMADAMKQQHDKSNGGVRARLFAMTTVQAHDEAVAQLKARIAQAGGFENFLKNAKAQMKMNLDKKCRIKKIASFALILPVTAIGMLTGMAASSALYYGTFNLVVLAWSATTVGAEGFAFPWFLDNMTVGCYKERARPEFRIMKPTPLVP